MLTLKLFFVVFALVSLAVLILSVKIWIQKNGRFPDTHISHNAEMRKRGIVCVQKWDALEQKRNFPKMDKKSLKIDVKRLGDDS